VGQSVGEPSGAKRERQRCSRQAASSGNSRENSISEDVDSEAFERFGLLRSTLATRESSHVWYLLSRDNRPNWSPVNATPQHAPRPQTAVTDDSRARALGPGAEKVGPTPRPPAGAN